MWYSIVVTIMSILIVILCPFEEWKEYVMFGFLVLIVSINRWESDKILKEIKANTKNKSEVLNIPRVSQRSEQLRCKYCGGNIEPFNAYCKHCGEVIP